MPKMLLHLFIILCVACGGGGESEPNGGSDASTSISPDAGVSDDASEIMEPPPRNLRVRLQVERLAVGARMTFEVRLANENVTDQAEITIEPAEIALVEDEFIVAQMPGNATLTARYDEETAEVSFEVTQARWRQVEVGYDFACALDYEGFVYCWGALLDHHWRTPTRISEVQFERISVDYNQGCATTPDRDLYCWGDNTSGQLGRAGPGSVTPQPVESISDVVDFDVGLVHTCAIRDGGYLYCWGSGFYGQIGIRTDRTEGRIHGISGTRFSSVNTGDWSTCAIRTDGSSTCWGNNLFFQLGTNYAQDVFTQQFSVATESKYTDIGVGRFHGCGRLSTGELECWGHNDEHSPMGTSRQGWWPKPELFHADVAAMTLSTRAMCILSPAGAALCSGYNVHGVLGNGTQNVESGMVSVPGRWQSIDKSGFAVCGIDFAGDIYCWGNDRAGLMGGQQPLEIRSPHPTALDSENVWIGTTELCWSDRGAVFCRGMNHGSKLGNGTERSGSALNSGYANASKILLSENHACALEDSGTVKCAGVSQDGSLGVDKSVVEFAETVNLPAAAVELEQSKESVTAILDDGRAFLWGNGCPINSCSNPYQLPYELRFEPTDEDPVPHIVSGAIGQEHVCFLDQGGELWCAGQKRYFNPSSPWLPHSRTLRKMDISPTFESIEALGQATCGLDEVGDVYCIGDWIDQSRIEYEKLTWTAPITEIVSGDSHFCVLDENGSVACLGEGPGVGQSDTSSLAQVEGIEAATRLVAYAGSTCAFSDQWYCWGWNYSGVITGAAPHALSPVQITFDE